MIDSRGKALLEIAYWWDAGLRTQAPKWVLEHPLWPPNNDMSRKQKYPIAGGKFNTPCPGRDRLWEAINVEFGLGL